MRKTNLALLGAIAFVCSTSSVEGEEKTLTFAMPACPIKQATIPPTKVPITLPSKNPVVPFTVSGTVQITDQTGSSVILTQIVGDTTLSGIDFARTVKTIAHATGSLTFDKGCKATDPYGSNNCHWDWGTALTVAFQGALQEDITSGKLIADLTIDGTTPFGFTCPVCGASCTITIPKHVDDGKGNELWVLLFGLIRLPLSLANMFSQ